MPLVVMDTNVAMVASELAEQASPDCIVACIDKLLDIQRAGTLLIDDSQLIILEYVKALGFAGRPGVGRAFAKWAFDHQSNDAIVRQVHITPRRDGGWRRFEEFPHLESLRRFDADDQVFAAVAIASGEDPPILNAVDSDWWNYRTQLAEAGIRVEFLCPEYFSSR
jgi:hypothetical protein